MDIKKSLILVLIFTLLVSCGEDEPTSPVEPGASSTGTFSARIGTINWNADEVRAYKQGTYTRINGTQEISNAQNKYSSISVYIDIINLKEPKLFGIGEDGGGFNYSARARVEATLRNDNTNEIFYGQYIENISLLNVTSIDDRQILGDFEFRSYTKTNPIDSLNVINGSFNIKF